MTPKRNIVLSIILIAGPFVLLGAISISYIIYSERKNYETIELLRAAVPIGSTKFTAIKRLGEPAETIKAHGSPSDYFWRGYSREEREISKEVLIFNGPFVNYEGRIGFRNHIVYVYISKDDLVEYVFIAKG